MGGAHDTKKQRSGRWQRGQAMVEFTIVLPIFLLLLLGIAQLGVAFNNYLALTDAVRAGARYGATEGVCGSCNQSQDTINKVQASGSNLDWTKAGAGVTVTSTWASGSDLRVCGAYPYDINLLGLVVASGNLNSCTTERVE